MKQPAQGALCLLFASLFLLTACSGVSVKDAGVATQQAYQQRADIINTWSEWGLTGKISLDDGEDGGSGKLRWSVQAANSELDFHAAFGRGAWRLQIRPGHAVLTEANGDQRSASSVNGLLRERMGWPLPVEALQWWVRGLAAPGPVESQEMDSSGLLRNLQQFGWHVEFSRYDNGDIVPMPKRLNATMKDYRVKLAISQWQMSDNHVIQK